MLIGIFIRENHGLGILAAGIVLAIFSTTVAYHAVEKYSTLGCAVAWNSQCTETNNFLMGGMAILAVSLAVIALGVILLLKLKKWNRMDI